MAVDRNELIRWLKTLPKDAEVGIDEGGLALQQVGDSDSYYEIGGLPDEEEYDGTEDYNERAAKANARASKKK